MLKQLYIKNFALIDTLDMRFFPGFSVITGETGAGKSIILGALNLLLGQRADIKSIKADCSKCTIEAHFDISRYGMEDFFVENEIDYDPNDCIMRREISATGKSRAFINDTPVALGIVKVLGQQLIDIHSQHQNLLLSEENFQLNVVDIIAQSKALLEKYKASFAAYNDARREVAALKSEIAASKEKEDFLRFQYRELHDAMLVDGIQEELELESEKLSHVEDIKTALYNADNLLNYSEAGGSVLERMKEASRSLSNVMAVYPDIKSAAERLESCYIELKDISSEISNETEGIDFDPKRLDGINNKLDSIYTLEKKYHAESVGELIRMRDEIQTQLDHIDNSDEELSELEAKASESLAVCKKVAAELTDARRAAAKTIEKEMLGRLVPLGIPNVRFAVSITPKELGADGCDGVSFLFSANTSTPMQPVSQVASGGEIARVMLSLKAMISGAVKLPTIIFDEIDTGVSGKIAEKMGDIMQEMARAERQVISITHLPQIASKGTNHYRVFKEETPTGTKSRMLQLEDEARVKEIAQMLSGTEITDAAMNNARELLRQA